MEGPFWVDESLLFLELMSGHVGKLISWQVMGLQHRLGSLSVLGAMVASHRLVGLDNKELLLIVLEAGNPG